MAAARSVPEQLAAAASINICQAPALCFVQLCVEQVNDCLINCTPHWPFLQCRRPPHRPAKGVCADEVEDTLEEFHEEISEHITKPTYVLDRPRIHTSVRWQRLQGGSAPIIAAPHPRHSPDFNRPVEHFIHDVKQEFRNLLRVIDVPREPKFYHDMLFRAYDNCCTKEMIRGIYADIITLPRLWSHVSTPKPRGSGGDWPLDKKLT